MWLHGCRMTFFRLLRHLTQRRPSDASLASTAKITCVIHVNVFIVLVTRTLICQPLAWTNPLPLDEKIFFFFFFSKIGSPKIGVRHSVRVVLEGQPFMSTVK